MTSELAKRLGAEKGAATLLVLFIPSVDRYEQPVDQAAWVDRDYLEIAFPLENETDG